MQPRMKTTIAFTTRSTAESLDGASRALRTILASSPTYTTSPTAHAVLRSVEPRSSRWTWSSATSRPPSRRRRRGGARPRRCGCARWAPRTRPRRARRRRPRARRGSPTCAPRGGAAAAARVAVGAQCLSLRLVSPSMFAVSTCAHAASSDDASSTASAATSAWSRTTSRSPGRTSAQRRAREARRSVVGGLEHLGRARVHLAVRAVALEVLEPLLEHRDQQDERERPDRRVRLHRRVPPLRRSARSPSAARRRGSTGSRAAGTARRASAARTRARCTWTCGSRCRAPTRRAHRRARRRARARERHGERAERRSSGASAQRRSHPGKKPRLGSGCCAASSGRSGSSPASMPRGPLGGDHPPRDTVIVFWSLKPPPQTARAVKICLGSICVTSAPSADGKPLLIIMPRYSPIEARLLREVRPARRFPTVVVCAVGCAAWGLVRRS